MRGLTACPDCGSLELRSVKASEGGIGVAFFDLSRCRRCAWQGMPLEFDDEVSWRAFVAAKAGWQEEEGEVAPGSLPPRDPPVASPPRPGPISACPQCGARDLRMEGTGAACPHCLWRGTPRQFAEEAAWKAFASERKNLKGRGGEAG